MKRLRPSRRIIVILLGALFLLIGGCWPFSSEQESDAADDQITLTKDQQVIQSLPVAPQEKKPAKEIVFEEPSPPQTDLKDSSTPPCDTPQPPSVPEAKPKIAIIIDDMGYHQKIGEALLDLDLNLTFSFLPHAPFTPTQEEKAYQLGRGILLHQPMQPRDKKWDPGQGALMLVDSPELIRETVLDNLTRVPHARGANNHMGSLFTEDAAAMRHVLTLLKSKQLFFIDSFTSAQSKGLDEARKLKIKTARRHVFLDNIHRSADICRQLEKLIKLAKQQGYAIGIGHPNQATLSALTKCRKQLLENVAVVDVRELIH